MSVRRRLRAAEQEGRMEKDSREPIYTEHGYVYDYEEDPSGEDPREEISGEDTSGEEACEGKAGLNEAGKGAEAEEENTEETGSGKRRLLPLLTALFLILGLAAGIFFGNRMNREKKIMLDRYVILSAAGYDGYGKAEVSLDRDALESDIADSLLSKGAITAAEGQSSLEAFRSYEHYDEIMTAIRLSLDREEDLSNGDTVTLTVTYEPEDPDGYGLVCRADPVLYTVSGLPEVTDLDPFSDLIVTVSGIGPDGMLHMEWDDSFPWTYAASQDRGLSNGQELQISVVPDEDVDEKALAAGWGYVLTRTQMSYQVTGLPFYAADISDLSETVSGEILDFAKEKVLKQVTEGYAPDESVTDLVPAGTLLAGGRDDEGSFFNKIFLLFRVSYSSRDTALDYYYYVSCRDLILYPDGTWMLDEDSCEYPVSLHGLFGLMDRGDYVRIDRLHAVTGFASEEDFYTACIEPLKAVCTVSGEMN